jgi:hypothetical protein
LLMRLNYFIRIPQWKNKTSKRVIFYHKNSFVTFFFL